MVIACRRRVPSIVDSGVELDFPPANRGRTRSPSRLLCVMPAGVFVVPVRATTGPRTPVFGAEADGQAQGESSAGAGGVEPP